MDNAKENERDDGNHAAHCWPAREAHQRNLEGLQMLRCVSELWVFTDNGVSMGMALEIEQAGREDMPVRYFKNFEEMDEEMDIQKGD